MRTNIDWLEKETSGTSLKQKTPKQLNELSGRLAYNNHVMNDLSADIKAYQRMCVTLGTNPDRMVILENGEIPNDITRPQHQND